MRSVVLFLLLLLEAILNITWGEPLYGDIFRCKKEAGNYLPNSSYEASVLTALVVLTRAKTSQYSYEVLIGEISATATCAGYLEVEACRSCMKSTWPLLVQKCPNHKQALAWRIKCMVQYATFPNTHGYNPWFVAHETSQNKTKDVEGLDKTLKTLVDKLSKEATSNEGSYAYGTLSYGSRQTVFMAMQCIKYLSTQAECNQCLLLVSKEMKPCCSGALAAATLTSGCYMRYAHADFRSQ